MITMTRLLLLTVGLVLILAACSQGTNPPPGDTGVTLSVTVNGPGTVTGDLGSLRCTSGTCSAELEEGDTINLTAEPTGDATFQGWSGDVTSSDNPLRLTLSADTSVTATFQSSGSVTLSVAVDGPGTVTSDLGGIDCPGTCSAVLEGGDVVNLTAEPAGGASFSGWSGACSGTSTTCQVTMNTDQAVTATFQSSGGTTYPAGTVFLDSSDLELNYDAGFKVHQLVGIRFVPELPAGATIDSARILFTPKEGNSNPLTVSVYAQDAADAPTFVAETNNISSRARTAAVTWEVPAWDSASGEAEWSTPDLSGLMTEAGWTSGNGVVFIIEGDMASTNNRNAYSADASGNQGPKLVIAYNGDQTEAFSVPTVADDAEENLEEFTTIRSLRD